MAVQTRRTTRKKKRAAIYVRLSEFREGDTTYAPERQEGDARAHVDRNGWELTVALGESGVFYDLDVSGWVKKRKAPGFDRLLDAVDDGQVDVVVIWKIDRLYRSARDFLNTLHRFEQAGVELASVSDHIDTTTPAGRAQLTMLAAFAQMESDNTSYRVRSYTRSEAERGSPHTGGRRRFGLERDNKTIVEPEAALIRQAVTDFIDGTVTLAGVATRWTQQGVLTPYGNKWTGQTVRQMFRQVRLAGFREHVIRDRSTGAVLDRSVYTADHPAIISLDDFTKLHRLLDRRSDGYLPPSTRRALLTGFARCGRCGHGMNRTGSVNSRVRYKCDKGPNRPGCGGVVIHAQRAEDTVWDLLRARLLIGGLGTAPPPAITSAAGDLRRRIEDANEQLTKVALDHFVHGTLPREQFVAVSDALQAAIADAEGELSSWRPRGAPVDFPRDPDGLDAWWKAAPVALKRSLLEDYVDHIVIRPATSSAWDSSRVKPHWR